MDDRRTRLKRRAVTATLGACALAVLVAWLWREPPPAAAAPPPPPALGPRLDEPLPAVAAAPRATPPPEAPSQPPPAEEATAPIIDEVTVEKSEVCEGEENLITLRAHTLDGTDAFLHYMVGSTGGQRVPYRSWLADDGEAPPPLEVRVFGRNNVVTSAPVPPFLVKKCKPARSALVTPRLRANTFSDFEFQVKLVEAPVAEGGSAVPFKPRSYEWSFGDGTTAVTQEPYATHNYEERQQDSLFSDLLVEVKVRGNAEEPVVGRTSLQLLNPTFEDLAYKGVVTLLVQLTPRFPELGSDGVVRQKVRLFHHRDRPVFIHNAVLFRHSMVAGAPVASQPVSPSTLLGTSAIPPGHGIEFEARLDTHRDPDVFSLEHYLEGKDSEGNPVRGAFSVMRPPPKPTKENNIPVMDPLFKAKIMAARKILNRPFVTDEDIWKLERAGQFAELEAEYNAKAGPQPTEVREPPRKDPGPPPEGPTATPGGTDDRTGTERPKPPPR